MSPGLRKTKVGRLELRGAARAPGIAIAPSHVFRASFTDPMPRTIPSTEVQRELTRFDDAISDVRSQLEELKVRATERVGGTLAAIFDAQTMILSDPQMQRAVQERITKQRQSADTAFTAVIDATLETIRSARHESLREMAGDISGVRNRVLQRLVGGHESPFDRISEPCILFASQILPTDMMGLKRSQILGIVTERGGEHSHTMLLAKSMRVPAVIGTGVDIREIPDGFTTIIDGFTGAVILDPNEETVTFYERKKKRARAPWPKRFDALKDQPAVTTDGVAIELGANIDLAEEAAFAADAGAEAIGLYRTEYLFLQNNRYPGEAEQVRVYSHALHHFRDRPLTVRLYDLGSDKVEHDRLPERNPALGLRGARLVPNHRKSFKAQMRALLRAGANHRGRLRTMVPMITTADELTRCRSLWRDAVCEVERANRDCDPDIPLGIMIETPAAVFAAAQLARQAGFFSVGTNDLIQYIMAADRDNHRVAHLFRPLAPTVLRALKMVFDAARDAGIPASVCGEMAALPVAVPLLVGLGATGLSVAVNAVPRTKAVIRATCATDAKALTAEALAAADATAVERLARDYLKKAMPRGLR